MSNFKIKRKKAKLSPDLIIRCSNRTCSFFQAVDVVGQAGKPKTITGFQTHTTPVLLAYGERAELATEECILYLITTYDYP